MKIQHAVVSTLLGVMVGTSLPAAAANPAYLSQFPAVGRVKSEIKGANAMETAARQMGAFWQLQQIIKDLSGPRWIRDAWTPDERRLLGQYGSAYQEADKPYAALENSMSDPERPKWNRLHGFYEVDESFRDELLNRFFSPDFRNQYLALKGELHARAVARSRAAANRRARVQAETSGPAGGGQAGAQTGEQALQQLTEGLTQALTSMAGSQSAAQPGGPAYVAAANSQEANQQWQRALSKWDTFESSDEFVLLFLRPGFAGMMCHGGLMAGQKAYRVEAQDGHVVLKIPMWANATWALALRQDGVLVSQNARRIQLFGADKDEKGNYKIKPCGVEEFMPKPRSGANAAAKPGQPGAAAAGNADFYLAQGEQFYDGKDYANAVAAFKKSIALKPSSGAYNDLGNAYNGLKQRNEAVSAYREAIRLKPDNGVAYYGLGTTYNDLGQYDDAIKAFQQALRLRPSLVDAYYYMGGESYALRRYPEAEMALKQSIRSNRQVASSYYLLGLVYVATGKKAEALEAYRKLQTMDKPQAQQLYQEISGMKGR